MLEQQRVSRAVAVVAGGRGCVGLSQPRLPLPAVRRGDALRALLRCWRFEGAWEALRFLVAAPGVSSMLTEAPCGSSLY